MKCPLCRGSITASEGRPVTVARGGTHAARAHAECLKRARQGPKTIHAKQGETKK